MNGSKLLFVCAHPAKPGDAHTPYAADGIGLDSVRIAQAFLIAPKTMGQRLFPRRQNPQWWYSVQIPQERDLPERLTPCWKRFTPLRNRLGRHGGADHAGATWPRKRVAGAGLSQLDAR